MTDTETRGMYGDYWDTYVAGYGGDGWPGDEWGTEEAWTDTFDRLFRSSGVHQWKRAVEIGSGSGKYTERVLTSTSAEVHAFDVSAKFLEVLQERCSGFRENGRLTTTVLEPGRPEHMFETLTTQGWVGEVDALYSIDAMVHVDLQYLVAYLLTAGLVLRPGGMLVMTFADACTDGGFKKLLAELRVHYPRQVDQKPSAKFEWLGPDMVRNVLTQLGFAMWLTHERRDLEVVARLVDPAKSRAVRRFLLGDG